MTNNFIDNNDSSDSSIFQGKILQDDLSQQAEIDKYKAAIEESFRKDFLRHQEVENQAYGHVDKMLSGVELKIEENEGSFTDGIDSLLAKLFKFFNFMDSELEMEANPQAYRITREKKEKNLLAAIIKFLHDKLKKLIKAVFSRDLSLNDRLDEEIKELQAKLDGGGLSEEEFTRVLDRLESLRDLKLKLQIFVTGWVISTVAAMLEVELTALVEAGTSKEEDKKAEKTSPKEKEATKEVREDVEIKVKVDEREKPAPISLFDFSSGLAKPIPLTKPEFDLLREPIRNIVIDSPLKVVIEVPKQEVKEKQKEENKQAKPERVICPAAPVQPATNTAGIVRNEKTQAYSDNRKMRKNLDNNKGSVFVDHCKFNFANMGIPKGAEYKPQQSSVDNAQPTSECNNVKVNHVNSMGKAPLI